MPNGLTKTQEKVFKLNAAGLSYCEIADLLEISQETVKTHFKNIKEILKMQKANELSGFYMCKLNGQDWQEVRKQIIKSVVGLGLSLLIFFQSLTFSPDDSDKLIRRPLRRSRNEYEHINIL